MVQANDIIVKKMNMNLFVIVVKEDNEWRIGWVVVVVEEDIVIFSNFNPRL
jgi:hypothetical protein